VFNLGAFYHPEEFLTAVLQVYAREHKVPFDCLQWATDPMAPGKITEARQEGIYVEGLFLEGAKWDAATSSLIECGQIELITKMPVVHLKPTEKTGIYDMTKTYECPMYRTQNRGSGAMGLSNYLMSIFLPSEQRKPDHWIQRSVADRMSDRDQGHVSSFPKTRSRAIGTVSSRPRGGHFSLISARCNPGIGDAPRAQRALGQGAHRRERIMPL
jgi:hypothetical protein